MGLNLVHLFAHLCWPVMPVMAKKIHEAIHAGCANDDGPVPWWFMPGWRTIWTSLRRVRSINPPDVLFAKIMDEQVEPGVESAFRRRFGPE